MVRGHGAVGQAFASTAPSAVLFIACFYFVKASFGESVGSPLDLVTQKVVQQCLNTPEDAAEKYGGPPGFGFGRCPNLIECVSAESSEVTKAGMAVGTSIAALIPTILVLVGAGPSELIRLSFMSPIRALATCLFGVGLPSNLFEQIQKKPQTDDAAPIEYPASVHRGVMQFAFPFSYPRRRQTVILRVVLDMLIVALASIMLWCNWKVGRMIMVTFRCEYRWLLFFWLVAGLAWGLIAVGSLVATARSVEVRKKNNGRKVAWRELLGMSYSVRRRGARGAASASLPLQQQTHGAQTLGTRLDPTNSEDEDNNEMLIVRVEFPNETSWRWWNTFIQAIAVGVYLYATFVLCSTLFLTGYESILYCVCMVLSLSAIRIMSALF